MVNRGRGSINRFTRGRLVGDTINSGKLEMKSADYYPLEINYDHLGQRLKDERKRLHYTQEQVAEKIGITPAFVGHIERGERSLSLDTLIKFCNFYGVTIDYLLTDILPPNTDEVTEQIRALLQNQTKEQQIAVLEIIKAVIRNI